MSSVYCISTPLIRHNMLRMKSGGKPPMSAKQPINIEMPSWVPDSSQHCLDYGHRDRGFNHMQQLDPADWEARYATRNSGQLFMYGKLLDFSTRNCSTHTIGETSRYRP